MKFSALLPLVVTLVAGSHSAFALSGGPVYPTSSEALSSGTYQAILRGENMLGVVIFGTTAAPNATTQIPGQGLSALYYKGETVYGTCFGTASATSKDVAAVFEASRTRSGAITVSSTLNPGEIISFDVNDVVRGSGSFSARFPNSKDANFSGNGQGEFSLVNGLDVSPADPYVATETVDFDVFGLRSSVTPPVFGTLPTVETPSVVATGTEPATAP